MLAAAITGAVRGIDGYLVRVEVDLTGGVPAFQTVGLPDAAVREARERVKSAMRNTGFGFPGGRITVNLAPADVKKQGSAFDLALAVGLLAANQKIQTDGRLDRTLLLGELALDGAVRPVRGVLPIVAAAREEGLDSVIVPRSNRGEAALVEGLDVLPVTDLLEATSLLQGLVRTDPWKAPIVSPVAPELADLRDVKGQFLARRALEIAAAGRHNLLLCGPPGAGKTLLARRMPSILPELSFEEALEVTKVHSVAGKLDDERGLLTQPPFRAPHHTASWAAMVGGGAGPVPGEVSLAHRGVLFLDELAEFPRSALEALRQPLEDGTICVSRVSRSVRYPASFILVAAMNPCPCGFQGAENRTCSCSPTMIARYRSKISGPLLDRIDLHVFVRPLSSSEILAPTDGECSAGVRERVLRARDLQRKRFRRSRTHVNAQMTPQQVARFCQLDPRGDEILRFAIDRIGLSARGTDRVLKVARTVADLSGSDSVGDSHVREAIQYRVPDSLQ